MTERPRLWLIAGPNGVGKTTYAFRHIRAVSGSVRFINLDEIARGVSPLDPDAMRRRAARVALELTADFIHSGTNFSIETTLAGRTHLRTIEAAHDGGFDVTLLYFIVADVETCLSRVARRVAEGGHAVPENDVRRRFARSIANFQPYAATVDVWRIFDNDGARPITMAEGRHGCLAMIDDMAGAPATLTATVLGLPRCPG